jgi:hypothetical protein
MPQISRGTGLWGALIRVVKQEEAVVLATADLFERDVGTRARGAGPDY